MLKLTALTLTFAAGAFMTENNSRAAPKNADANPPTDAMRAASPSHCPDALNFKMADIDGKEKNLCGYAGKVVMMVNVASRCGYTDQYKDLEALYLKYKDRGFVILGFPANNFGGQEPGTNGEIKKFCSTKYDVTFDMFAKTDVKGGGINPLYKFLTGKRPGYSFDGDISWNFNKFLIGRNGQVIGRWPSKVEPLSKEITEAVEQAAQK